MNLLSLEPGVLFNGLLLALLVLLVTMLLGMIRAIRGPSLEDRFTALLLLGSSGVAILFLRALLLQRSALFDVALVLAMLAVVITVALTRGSSPDHD